MAESCDDPSVVAGGATVDCGMAKSSDEDPTTVAAAVSVVCGMAKSSDGEPSTAAADLNGDLPEHCTLFELLSLAELIEYDNNETCNDDDSSDTSSVSSQTSVSGSPPSSFEMAPSDRAALGDSVQDGRVMPDAH